MSKAKPAIAKAKTWIVGLTFFLFLNTLLFYGFVRGGTWVILAVLSILLYRKIGHLKFMALTMSFVFATLILLFVAERGLKKKIYYRSHEMLVTTDWDGLKIYQKNADIVFDQKHGDLRNMAPDSTELVNAPRTVKYRVDSFGYRNDADYAGQPYVLVGDSFVVGAGTSQEHILTTQLKEKHGIEAYNLAHPGDTGDYVQYMKKFNAEYGTTHKALVFLFEGNDFAKVSRPKTVDWLGSLNGPYLGVRNLFRKYRSFFHDTQLYRYTFIVYKALTSGPGGEFVKIKKIGDRNIGLYTGYVAASEQVECKLADDMTEAFGEVKETIHAFVFVPTKYRVYADLWDEPATNLPNANLDCANEVGKRLGVPVVDLTPAMQKAAKELLETKNELIFWPDDTHWNPSGIAIGAQVVAAALKEAPQETPKGEPADLSTLDDVLLLPGGVPIVTTDSDEAYVAKQDQPANRKTLATPAMLYLKDTGKDPTKIDFRTLPRVPAKHAVISDVRDRGGKWVHQHAYLAFHDGLYWAMWSDGPGVPQVAAAKHRNRVPGHDQPDTRVSYATSKDGLNWSEPQTLTGPPRIKGFGWIARGFWKRDGELLALATHFNAPSYPGEGLSLEAFHFDAKQNKWIAHGTVLDDAMNNFPPKKLPNGQWMMSRRDHKRQVTVMVGGTKAFNDWTIQPLASYGDKHKPEEPYWYTLADRQTIVGLLRDNGGSKRLLRTFSIDNGKTWSQLVTTNFPDATSKFFALHTTHAYHVLVSNANPKRRDPLTIAVSKDGVVYTHLFYLVGGRHIDYPHVIEHDGHLLIAFSGAKQTMELMKVKLNDIDQLIEE